MDIKIRAQNGYAIFGLMVDYVVKIAISNKEFDFKSSPAAKGAKRGKGGRDMRFSVSDWRSTFAQLTERASTACSIKRSITDNLYNSILACAILEGFYRSYELPKPFLIRWQEWNYWEKKFTRRISKASPDKISELLDFYANKLFDYDFHCNYCLDIIYKECLQHKLGDVVCINPVFANQRIVGGADGDLILDVDDYRSLVDIKTKKNPISVEEIRQLIGYWLLHDPKKDSFSFTGVGLFYPLTGSIKIIPEELILKEYFQRAGSADEIRSEFLKVMRTAKRTY